MPEKSTHKTCKRSALNKLERISYLAYQLRCMDDCPKIGEIIKKNNRMLLDIDDFCRAIRIDLYSR